MQRRRKCQMSVYNLFSSLRMKMDWYFFFFFFFLFLGIRTTRHIYCAFLHVFTSRVVLSSCKPLLHLVVRKAITFDEWREMYAFLVEYGVSGLKDPRTYSSIVLTRFFSQLTLSPLLSSLCCNIYVVVHTEGNNVAVFAMSEGSIFGQKTPKLRRIIGDIIKYCCRISLSLSLKILIYICLSS